MTKPHIRAAAIGAAAVLAGVAAPTAAGARNPYTASGLCGPGYQVIDRKPMYDNLVTTGRRVKIAESVLMYNARNGNNCAVTLKRFRLNKRTHTYITLARRPLSAKTVRSDRGDFRYYAGPVYLWAAGKCVQWQGGMNYHLWAGEWWTPRQVSFRSGWVHCR